MKKEYIVKDTIINLNNHTILVYYHGLDDYVHDFVEYAKGWKRRKSAERYIEEDINHTWNKRIDDNHCIESNKWLHHYEIIERDAE